MCLRWIKKRLETYIYVFSCESSQSYMKSKITEPINKKWMKLIFADHNLKSSLKKNKKIGEDLLLTKKVGEDLMMLTWEGQIEEHARTEPTSRSNLLENMILVPFFRSYNFPLSISERKKIHLTNNARE